MADVETTEGVKQAVLEYLKIESFSSRNHPMAAIRAATESAVKQWLDENKTEIIRVLAEKIIKPNN